MPLSPEDVNDIYSMLRDFECIVPDSLKKSILSQRGNLNALDPSGLPILFYVALVDTTGKGSKVVADCAADVNMTNNLGSNALHFAGSVAAAKKLVELGIQFKPNKIGVTPLISAAEFGKHDLVDYLLSLDT